ncbi:MAG: hypothetical protein ABII64_08660 [Elusimicrobiota bacterium]
MAKKNKKPYVKPSVKSEKIIETAALACGKCIAGNPIYQAACKSYKKFS